MHKAVHFSRHYLLINLLIVICILAQGMQASAQEASPWAEVGKLPIRYIDPTTYDANSSNWSIAQDNKGILYIGNSDGLLVHDGALWELIEMGGTGIVRSVAVAHDQTVYVGGHLDLGYLGTDSLGAPAFVSLKKHIPEAYQDFQDVWQVLSIQERVFFITPRYLFRWKDNTFSAWQKDDNYDTMARIENQLIFTHNDTLRYLDESDKVKDVALTGEGISQIREISSDGASLLYGLSQEGLFRCQITLEATSTCTILETDVDDLFNRGKPYTLLPLPSGNIAIGFDGEGVALLDASGRLLRHIDDAEGLENLEVMGLYSDREGALWLALFDGLARLEPEGPLSSFDRSKGLPSSVNATYRWKGRLFAATMLGLYELDPGTTHATATFKKLRNSDEFNNCFNFDVIQDTLLSTCLRGVVRIDSEPGRISSTRNIYTGMTFQLAVDKKQPDVLYVTEQGHLSKLRFQQGTLDLIHQEPIAPVFGEFSVERRPQDTRLWVEAYPGNVVRVDIPDDGSPWRTLVIGEQNNVTGEFKRQIILDGNVFIATEQGLNKLAENTAETPLFESIPALDNRELVFVEKQPQEKTWVILDDSLRMLTAQGDLLPNPLPPASETLREITSIVEEADGTVWVGHARGLSRYSPPNTANTDTNPTVLISKITTITRDSLLYSVFASDTHAPTVSHANGSLRFSFAAQVFDRPERVHYRTWLEGFEDTWQPWTKDRIKEFTKLREGTYTLHLQARDAGGRKSEITSLSFSVHPPWYRTTWAYFLWTLTGFIVLGGLVWGGTRLQTRRLQARNNMMARLIDEQTEEIRAKKASLEEAVESLEVAYEEVTVINEDLTRTNHALENRTDQLRDALEANKEILGITAHDLKNPLGGIIGLAEMVLEDLAAGPKATYQSASDNIPLLKSEAERMFQIIKDLLDTHREGEETKLKKEKTLLGDIVSAVARWNAKQAAQKQITLHYHAKETLLAEVDVMAIQRVLDNYVSNAIKYSPAGSNVWITVEREAASVRVSVRDEGPGLTEEDMHKAFGKMQRLSAKPTAGEHSTGLGLFIVRKLVEAHEGSIGVDSVHGEGATFWFTLPLVELNDVPLQPAVASGLL